MTDSNETKTVTSRTPSHFAYNVRNREGGDNYWIRIGSAWAHADGNGFNIQLETVPLDGRIALRVASDKAKYPTLAFTHLGWASQPTHFFRTLRRNQKQACHSNSARFAALRPRRSARYHSTHGLARP